MSRSQRSGATRKRLLIKAEALFAQRGYHAVSIREITRAARCNLAAVNYHFGSKMNLYLAVFEDRWIPRAQRVQSCFHELLEDRPPLSAAVIVEALAQAFIEGPLSDEERQYHFQLMTRELAKPSAAFELLAGQIIQPFLRELAHSLRAFTDPTWDDETLMLNVLSIFAMVLYFNFARPTVARVAGRQYDEGFKNRLVQQIAQFALHGLGAAQKQEPPR